MKGPDTASKLPQGTVSHVYVGLSIITLSIDPICLAISWNFMKNTFVYFKHNTCTINYKYKYIATHELNSCP